MGIKKRLKGGARIGRSVTPSGKARYKKAVALMPHLEYKQSDI